ncbi:MAG: hypothetical protein A3F68_09700 [Acidobacteria bacterium RIFCSPLOWO2_12_FULL_54_10]|nr:MAG: hypothetical protein A3F68_09700 [Acidobacteria bacterium RIFCSPLOWO2_12_FULL_54_10]
MKAIKYVSPKNWVKFNHPELFEELSNAKAAVMSLKSIPYQRRWVQEIQQIQLKMEVAGSSRIEGAEFVGNELEVAIKAQSPEQLLTRSQKQANSAVKAYKWIAEIPDDKPIDEKLICDVHRLVVTDCDDDHCAPGRIREQDHNITFGIPMHRGATGGEETAAALRQLAKEAHTNFRDCDPLIQALALHYHLVAIHPFGDGNGRTARILEALLLQRASLKDSLFIAMSNYYYEEKATYLSSLSEVRARDYDLTPFLKFGLKGIAKQSERLMNLIKTQVSKEIFRNLMHDLFTRLQSTRKRVIVPRQLAILEKLLNMDGEIEYSQLADAVRDDYKKRKFPFQAFLRDVAKLIVLGAIEMRHDENDPKHTRTFLKINLEWPTTITDTEFFARLEKLPKSKTYGFLTNYGR